MNNVVSALKSGEKEVGEALGEMRLKTRLKSALSRQMKMTIAAVAVMAISFFILMSLAGSVSASSCREGCGDCSCAYEVKVDGIIFEGVDGVSGGDPAGFCGDGRIRVSAIVGVDGVGCCYGTEQEVRAELYVGGEYYGSALVKLSPSVHNRVDFSRVIYTNDFPVSSNVEVKVVAKTGCAEDERVEQFYIKDCTKKCEEECDWCDGDSENCDCAYHGCENQCENLECEKYAYDYGVLKVKVEACAEGVALADASVRATGVGGSTDYTKITHYNGYAVFTLHKGEYTVKASHEGYGEKEQEVYVYGGTTKEISLCLPGSCGSGFTGEFRCFGNYIQRQYTESDCTKSWKMTEYCPYGCLGGGCVPATQPAPTQQTKPTDVAAALVSLKGNYGVKACEVETFRFDVINIGSVEAAFNLSVAGEGAGLVFVPRSVALKPNERKPVLAYAYSCNEGDYPFTITASAAFNGEAEATSVDSILSVGAPEDTMLRTGWATAILACVVVIVVLVIWRIKLGIGVSFRRGRRAPEFFRNLGIDAIG